MSCERFKNRLADFALGAEDVELRAHLDVCPACFAELDAQRALFVGIDCGVAEMVSGEPSPAFAARVRQRIAREAAAPRPWFAGWQPITAAALAVIALVVALTLPRGPRPPQSVQQQPPKQEVVPTQTLQRSQVASTVPPAAVVVRGPRPPREGQMAIRREPEVLVPRGQMAAVMQLYDAVWSGKADGTTLMAQAVPIEELLKPLQTPELKIPPLEIERMSEEGKSTGSVENR